MSSDPADAVRRDEAAELLLLWAARETGVVDALMDRAGTPAEVAAEAGVTRRAARIAVAALADLGYLERVDGEYEPANRALGFLTKTDVRSIGRVPHDLDVVGAMLALPETMRTGDPPERPPEWTANRLGARADDDEAAVRAAVTAAVREAPGAGRVLDVLGAPGLHAQEFASRGLDATLFDRPSAVEPVRPLLATTPVEAVAGDPDEGLPGGFDLAFCAGVVRERGPAENRALLSAVREALAPGGTVVVVDHLRGRSPRATAVAARMLASTGGGDAHPPAAVTEWLSDAGFADARTAEVPGTARQAVAADRPRD